MRLNLMIRMLIRETEDSQAEPRKATDAHISNSRRVLMNKTFGHVSSLKRSINLFHNRGRWVSVSIFFQLSRLLRAFTNGMRWNLKHFAKLHINEH